MFVLQMSVRLRSEAGSKTEFTLLWNFSMPLGYNLSDRDVKVKVLLQRFSQ